MRRSLLCALILLATAIGCRKTDAPPVADTPTWVRHARCTEGADCVRRCEAGEAAVCVEASRYVRDGDGVVRDVARADRMLVTGCGLGSGGACLERAESIDAEAAKTQATGLRRRGLDLLAAGCDARNIDDCRSLVRAHALGLGPGGQKDPDAAQALKDRILPVYERLCDQGDGDACRSAGHLARGRQEATTADDERRALPFFDKACAIEAVHCWALGEAKQKLGLPGRVDIVRGCDADPNGGSCFDPSAPNDAELARKKADKLEHRCRRTPRRACLALGALDDSAAGAAVRDEATRAAHRIREAKMLRAECDAGAGDSCMLLAARLADNQCAAEQKGEMAALHEKACAGGDARGCALVAP